MVVTSCWYPETEIGFAVSLPKRLRNFAARDPMWVPTSFEQSEHIDRFGQGALSRQKYMLPLSSAPAGRRGKPKIQIVSRPRPPKPVKVVQAVALDQQLPKARKQHKQKRNVSIMMPMCQMWAKSPTPLDRKHLVPGAVSEWLMTGHRWFKPQLVHQTLYNIDGCFEPALVYVYNTWMNAQQLKMMYGDILEFISDVSDDVFGIDPDRYVKIRPEQVIQLDNPSGYPVFIHQNPIVDSNRTSEPATISVYSDTNVKPSQLKIAMNDAAYQLWGYSQQQWERYQVHNVEEPGIQDKMVPFFFSLFSPSTMYTIIALNLGVFYVNCKFATFQCNILRRDGKIIPMKCIFTTYLHSKFLHVSQFSFTDVKPSEREKIHTVPSHEVSDNRALLDLELPVLDNFFP